MIINLNVAVLTLAIISQDASAKKSEIEFIADFIKSDLAKSEIIAFLCWNKVDKFDLIHHLSQNNYIASIYEMDEDKIHPYNPPQNILFLIDLDCDNSIKIVAKAQEEKLFSAPYKWLLLSENTKSISIFTNYSIYPDSNVVFSHKTTTNVIDLYEIYKNGKDETKIIIKNIAKWIFGEGFQGVVSRILSHDRRNLNGTVLSSSVVIQINDSLNHLTDYRFRHVDSVSKVNYIFTNILIDYANGTRNTSFVNSWGYYNKTSKMYNGMIGSLQSQESEIGGTPMFITEDRLLVVDFVTMTTPTWAKFIFRQPPLSYVSNVFTLPFTRDVWISSFGLCILASFLLYFAVNWEWRQSNFEITDKALQKSFLDSVMLTIGAVAQQGTTNEPRSGAGKIVMIFTFIALMFLYVSYSANIVALLQSTATNIRTLEDLLNSRLKLGVEGTVYNHYYFEMATEKIRKEIYEKKIAPKGKKPNFMPLLEGTKKIQQGFFAFHGEVNGVYTIIGDLFLESEKCGIQEIKYLDVVEPYSALRKNSSYKEILKVGFRKMHERGIQSRELRKFFTKKPECLTSGGNFVSVGLLDAYAAFYVLAFGMGLSFLLFLGEKITYKQMILRNLIIK